mgnify:CR=1 FL=1
MVQESLDYQCRNCGRPEMGYGGKFETSGHLGEALHEMSLDGTDEQLGDVEDFGWYGLLVNTGLRCAPHAILSIDGFGFVDYQDYDTESAARDVWDNLEAEYTEFLEECKDGSNQGERGR